MEDEDAILMGEDARARDEDPGLTDAEPGADDSFELELDGEVHTLPGALKGAFLRQADYTRKTQELAEHRRALAAEREAVAQEAAMHRGAGADRIRLAAMEHQLGEFADVDWEAYAAQDAQGAQALWAAYQRLAEGRERLASAVAHHSQRAELEDARAAADAMAETGRTLAREIEGWSPGVAHQLVEYAQAFGVTMEELGQTADPRLWKLLHKAWRADQASEGEATAEARAVQPAVRIGGGGAGGGGVRDELGTKEWMRRRNAQTAAGR
jgi:hypothetical protein